MPRAQKRKSASPSPNKKPRFTLNAPVRSHTNKRMSEVVSFNNVVYLAGQVAEDASQDIKGQTQQVLASIDKLLAENHTDKTKIIRADIFLKRLEDFAGM
jgi:enamine deaminase RidA (YjgF/YER057c/UK114 family)